MALTDCLGDPQNKFIVAGISVEWGRLSPRVHPYSREQAGYTEQLRGRRGQLEREAWGRIGDSYRAGARNITRKAQEP